MLSVLECLLPLLLVLQTLQVPAGVNFSVPEMFSKEPNYVRALLGTRPKLTAMTNIGEPLANLIWLLILYNCAFIYSCPAGMDFAAPMRKPRRKKTTKPRAPKQSQFHKMIRPARFCKCRRLKAARLHNRRRAFASRMKQLIPKYGRHFACRHNSQVNHAPMPPPNWRAFQGGAGGGGAATTKRKQAERQQASLCDVLMTTIANWQQQQPQLRSKQARYDSGNHQTQKVNQPKPDEGTLITAIEKVLQQCRSRNADDNSVAVQIQQALETHRSRQKTSMNTTAGNWSGNKASPNRWGTSFYDKNTWHAWERWGNDWADNWQNPSTQTQSTWHPNQYATVTDLRFQEWTMRPKLLHLQTMTRGLAQGHQVDDGNIMHISTVEQFQEAKALFAAHNLSGHLTFLLTDQAKRDISGQGEFYTRVTCTRKHGRPKLEEVALIEAIPGYRGPWTHAPVKIQNSQVQIVPRVPVRITAPQHFRAAFLPHGSQDRPQHVISELAAATPGATVSMLTGGNWWTERIKHKTLLHCVLKLPQEVATAMVANSGEHGIFAVTLGNHITNQKVAWHKREAQESDESYLWRMSSLAHTRREGLKLRKDGSAELGLFMTDEDHSHWIANGFPSNWQSEEILRFLAEQQWQDVSVINRRAKRKGHTHLVAQS